MFVFFCSATELHNTTTRTIKRLVGGHLHHSVYKEGHNRYTSQPPNRLTKLYPWRDQSGTTPVPFGSTISTESAFNTIKSTETPTIKAPTTVNTRTVYSTPKESVFIVESQAYKEPDQSTNNDIKKDGFVESSAGDGKEESKNKTKDESKKTLSDQVAEGKYGLIQNELFKTPPKRPGIISYLTNPEIPKDTKHNFGGLSSDDIWLSEDHLLVLKGGTLNKQDNNEPWKPIDDYRAKWPQVRIPNNPEVPPPFPVQLDKNGPIHFIEKSQFPLVNPFTNESLLLFPEDGIPRTGAFNSNRSNLFARPVTSYNLNVPKENNGYFYPPPDAPDLYRDNNFTFSNPFLRPALQPPFAGNFDPNQFISPNGSLENSNLTDFFDEDDPSLYYPPPYTFVYKRNYTNLVEPGPLVPGIILPPPPEFFGRLEQQKLKEKERDPSYTTAKPHKQLLRPVYKAATTAPTKTTTIKPLYMDSLHPPNSYVRQKFVSPTKSRILLTTEKSMTQLNQLPKQEILAFVPKEAMPNDPFRSNKGSPVYYEYYNAQDKPSTQLKSVPIKTSTTIRPSSDQQDYYPRPYNSYLPIYNEQVYTTQKPSETIPTKASTQNLQYSNNYQNVRNKTSPKPFDTEIENIRQTIKFFRTQQQSTTEGNNNLPRNPKSKTVFEYSFDATALKPKGNNFSPPPILDLTPFKPMVQYSIPINSSNGFRGIPHTTEPIILTTPKATTISESPIINYYTNVGNTYRHKGNNDQANTSKRPSEQYHTIPLDVSIIDAVSPYQNNGNKNYYNTISLNKHIEQIKNLDYLQPNVPHPHSTVAPWLSIEKQVLREVYPKKLNVQIQSYSPGPLRIAQGVQPSHESTYVDGNSYGNNNNNYNGYFYRQPLNQNYYQYSQTHPVQPVHTHTPQANPYTKDIEKMRQQTERYPNQYQLNVPNNNSFINYRTARLPLNPNNGFITSYQIEQHRLPPYPGILSQKYSSRQQQNYPEYVNKPLHRDVLVNYKYPLPEINPDSEFLPPPSLLQPLPPLPPSPSQIYYSRLYRSATTMANNKKTN